jgi:hypothetical protein
LLVILAEKTLKKKIKRIKKTINDLFISIFILVYIKYFEGYKGTIFFDTLY